MICFGLLLFTCKSCLLQQQCDLRLDVVKAYSSKQVSCPYNPAHKFKEEKLKFHLQRCKDQKRVGHLFEKCNYNSIHIFRKGGRAEHQAECEFAQKMVQAVEAVKQANRQQQTQPKAQPEDKLRVGLEQEKEDECEKQLSDCEDCLEALSKIDLINHPKLLQYLSRYYAQKLELVRAKRRERERPNSSSSRSRSRERQQSVRNSQYVIRQQQENREVLVKIERKQVLAKEERKEALVKKERKEVLVKQESN